MIVAYKLAGQDNMSHANLAFFDKEDNKLVCKGCGCLNSPFYFDKNIKLKKKTLDYSTTYDGLVIVSERFKSFCIDKKIENLLFVPIESSEGFFYFFVIGKFIAIDIKKSEIKRKGICKVCGYNKEVIGGIQLFTNEKQEAVKGFYSSDTFWRTHYIFRQLFFVDIVIMKELKLQKMKGLYFSPLYSVY